MGASQEARAQSATMPRSVVIACQLFVAAYVLSLIPLLPGVGAPLAQATLSAVLAVLVFVVAWGALTLWLIGAVLQRRSWGRWALLAMLGLSWLNSAAQIVETFDGSFFGGAVDVFGTAMEMAGCVLLFGDAAAQWFAPETHVQK